MLLQQTLSNGTKIWKPNRRVMDGGKRVVFEGLTPIMPIKSETIRQEEILKMKYSSSTDMKSILVGETNTPIDMLTIASGEVWIITKDKNTGQVLKTKNRQRRAKDHHNTIG